MIQFAIILSLSFVAHSRTKELSSEQLVWKIMVTSFGFCLLLISAFILWWQGRKQAFVEFESFSKANQISEIRMEDKNTNITLDSPAEATSNSFERKKKKRKAHRLSDRTRNNEQLAEQNDQQEEL